MSFYYPPVPSSFSQPFHFPSFLFLYISLFLEWSPYCLFILFSLFFVNCHYFFRYAYHFSLPDFSFPSITPSIINLFSFSLSLSSLLLYSFSYLLISFFPFLSPSSFLFSLIISFILSLTPNLFILSVKITF